MRTAGLLVVMVIALTAAPARGATREDGVLRDLSAGVSVQVEGSVSKPRPMTRFVAVLDHRAVSLDHFAFGVRGAVGSIASLFDRPRASVGIGPVVEFGVLRPASSAGFGAGVGALVELPNVTRLPIVFLAEGSVRLASDGPFRVVFVAGVNWRPDDAISVTARAGVVF